MKMPDYDDMMCCMEEEEETMPKTPLIKQGLSMRQELDDRVEGKDIMNYRYWPKV